MKNAHFIITSGAVAAIALSTLAGCSKDAMPTEQQENTNEKYIFTLAVEDNAGLTKTTIEGTGSQANPFKAAWDADDCAGLFVGDDKNVKMSIDRIENGVAYFKGELSSQPQAGEQIYFYYPYNATQADTVTAQSVGCPLPYAQSNPDTGKHDDSVDYMWGNTTVGEDSQAGNLKLNYSMGFLRFSVKSVSGAVTVGEGSEQITADDKVLTVSIEAKSSDGSAKKLVGDFTLNLENGERTVPDAADGNNIGPKVLVNCAEGTTLGALDVWACVHPFTLSSADDILKIWIQTENHYIIREVKVSDLGAESFAVGAGGVKVFDINITDSVWDISVNPTRGDVIKTPEQFLCFVQDVKNGSYLNDVLTIGGNSFATKAPDAAVENRNIDKWLDEDGVARLGNDITVSVDAFQKYGGLASLPLWTKTFDGGGHTITFEDGTLLRPIFANVFSTGTDCPGIVRNLKVAGNMTAPEVPYIQGTCPLVGVLHGGEISGCQSDVNISVTSFEGSMTKTSENNIAMAGICRTMQGGTIKNCTNNGKITYAVAHSAFNSNQSKLVNAVYAGGIVALVGANYGTGAFGTNASADANAPFVSSPTITGCSNNGEISITNTAAMKNGSAYTWMQFCAAGGVTGWVWGGNADKFLTIENCHNKGAVTIEQAGDGDAASGIAGAGGLIGRAAPAGRYGSVLGPVNGSLGLGYWTGKVTECQDGFYLEVKNSDNSGRIAVNGKISQPATFFHKTGCGGIAGILFGGYESAQALISGCTNTGEIVGLDKSVAGSKSIADACSQNYISGGIIGYGGSVIIKDCHQSGAIGENGYNVAVGGIMGAAYNKFTVEGCTVKADLYRYMPTTVTKDVFAALVTNYIFTSANVWTRAGSDYAMYEGSQIKDCKVSGSVKYTKGAASGTALTDSTISSSTDVSTLSYCALSNSDINTGKLASGQITVSGLSHYAE